MPSPFRVVRPVAFAALFLVGCSDAAPVETDGGTAADGGTIPSGPDAATSACEPVVATASIETAVVSTDPASSKKVWIVKARGGKTNVTLTLRESETVAGGPAIGTFGEEQSKPGTAPIAFLLQTDCNAHGDHYHCGPSYVPASGDWKIVALDKAVGGAFHVEVSAALVEAKITSGVARPVEGGKSACVRALELHGTLAEP